MLRGSGHAAALALLWAAACSDDGTPGVPRGGAGGASAGAAGTSAGAAGAAGSSGAAGTGGAAGTSGSGGTTGDPDAGAPRISATIDGERVKLTVEDPIWGSACGRTLQLLQDLDGAWEPLIDDRPLNETLEIEAHYLDGDYRSDCRLTLGCDVDFCAPIEDVAEDRFSQRAYMLPREFVRVGDGAASTCERGDAGVPFDAGADLDAGIRLVPAIESRAPRGPLVVRVRYYTDARCSSPLRTVDVPVE